MVLVDGLGIEVCEPGRHPYVLEKNVDLALLPERRAYWEARVDALDAVARKAPNLATIVGYLEMDELQNKRARIEPDDFGATIPVSPEEPVAITNVGNAVVTLFQEPEPSPVPLEIPEYFGQSSLETKPNPEPVREPEPETEPVPEPKPAELAIVLNHEGDPLLIEGSWVEGSGRSTMEGANCYVLLRTTNPVFADAVLAHLVRTLPAGKRKKRGNMVAGNVEKTTTAATMVLVNNLCAANEEVGESQDAGVIAAYLTKNL